MKVSGRQFLEVDILLSQETMAPVGFHLDPKPSTSAEFFCGEFFPEFKAGNASIEYDDETAVIKLKHQKLKGITIEAESAERNGTLAVFEEWENAQIKMDRPEKFSMGLRIYPEGIDESDLLVKNQVS